jgi:hypothetical protein
MTVPRERVKAPNCAHRRAELAAWWQREVMSVGLASLPGHLIHFCKCQTQPVALQASLTCRKDAFPIAWAVLCCAPPQSRWSPEKVQAVFTNEEPD